MHLKDIYRKCEHLTIFEQRCVNDDFVELVFLNQDLQDWFNTISTILGTPRKAENQEPNANDIKLTAHTGGIRYEQTLFEKEFHDGTVIAKFWPWKDGAHTTLRMALLTK